MEASAEWTSLGQARALRRGDVSAGELVLEALERAEETAGLGAFVTLTAEAALSEADAVDRLIASTPTAERVGLPPLLGLPTVHKDLVCVRGAVTTHGSRAVPHLVATRDDPVPAAIRAAGAICIGKTQVPEFGIAAYSEGDLAAPARNPLDPALTAGGSSGGTATAIGSGVVTAAIGSDAGGSIRIPSGACGLVGLKPGRGRVPADVATPDPDPTGAPRLGVSGPMAATVSDAALWFDALVGDGGLGSVAAVERAEALRGLRIGVSFESPFASAYPVSFADEARRAVEAAAARLGEFGHAVEEARLAYDPRYADAFTTVWTHGLTRLGLDAEAEGRLGALAAMFLRSARSRSGDDLALAVDVLNGFARSAARQWGRYDAILTPALSGPPPEVGAFLALEPEADYRLQCLWAPQMSMVNVAGVPAVVCPAPGVRAHDRGVGVQLIGRVGGEVGLLQLAAQLTG